MDQKRNSRPFLPTTTAISLLVAAVTVGVVYRTTGRHASVSPAEKYALAHVQRTDLYPALHGRRPRGKLPANGDPVRAREHRRLA